MDHADACELLGLDPGVFPPTKASVHAAYRKAALESHPDRGGSNEEFQAVAEAKEVLMVEVETGIRRLSTGKRGENRDCNGNDAASSPGGGGGAVSENFWEGAKYNRPSGQSPMSPLRQMGKPVDLAEMDVDEVRC